MPATAPSPAGPPDGAELRASRIFLRPIANPFALGFVGLAVDSVLMTGTELHWFPVLHQHQTALLVLAFAPVVQIVSSVFGFLSRDAVAASGMGILAATWLCIGLALLSGQPGARSPALGVMLFVAGTGVMWGAVTAAQSKLLPAGVLGLAGLRFLLTGIYQDVGGGGWRHASGWCGVAVCAVALYAALALEIEDVRHRTVLPTLRHGPGREVLEPHLATQVEQVAAEAGVRSQL